MKSIIGMLDEMEKEEIINRLERAGCRISLKRLQILDEIIAEGKVVNIEQFWLKLRSKTPISWATVHSFLHQLYLHKILEKDNSVGRNLVYRIKEY
ncbi:hypothetical protein [Sphingobacterium sp. LRF_L2]|uniref:hypothetical protein n=1 Tax=Sphingobacterium sp. LRF_L2 TaxID=3369421 RepID=UPI003F64133C